jgi:hypothetical protein
MRRSASRLLLAAAASVVVLSGCGASAQGGPGTPGSPSASSVHVAPTITVSVAGHPSARVTDTAIRGLTPAEIHELENLCAGGLSIPGEDQKCTDKMQEYLRIASARCGPGSGRICVLIGRIAALNVAYFKETGSRGGDTTCTGPSAALCRGLAVSGTVVNGVLPSPSPTVAPSTSSPSSAFSGSPGASSSSAAPATSSSGSPADPPSTGAGSSP